jgi:4-amino-4-deoxy-L-arabinose transferase-like glycosyltransferase
MQRSVRRDIILLALGTLVLCGLFFEKAYHIDDTLVVWTAQQIAAHPSDFYGFDANWFGFSQPVVQIFANPPGAAYYAAVFGALFGWSEPVMHASMALMAVALVLGVYWLARQFNANPLAAAVFALVSPGILVSMGTMMTDLPMTALWVWAIALWLRGLEERHTTLNAVSGLLIGLAALTKYFAISLVPLLLVYTLLSGRRRWARATWLLIPFILLGLLDLYMQRRYGMSHLLDLSEALKVFHEQYERDAWRNILTGLAFLGAGGAPALFLAPWLWGRAGRIGLCGGGAAIAALTVILARSGWQAGVPQISYSWWFWLQYGLWIAAGLHIIALALAEVWNRRDRVAVLLGLWLGGTLFFGMFVNLFVNMRVILPALPAVALLCARRLRVRSEFSASATPRAVWLGLAAGLMLSLCVAQADIRLANSARTAAERIAPEKRGGRTWFSGHWGFQFYMEARGAKPIDVMKPDIHRGDTVVTPANASNRIPIGGRGAYIDESFELPVCSWLSTMQAECGAGFYSDLWGPLPFVFGPTPPEQYEVILP